MRGICSVLGASAPIWHAGWHKPVTLPLPLEMGLSEPHHLLQTLTAFVVSPLHIWSRGENIMEEGRLGLWHARQRFI